MNTFRFSVLTTISTFLLLGVGGTVNPTGSSLACPDWPTCYGTFFPEMTDGVEYEHTHRVAGAIVGLLTCILGFMIWRTRTNSTLRKLGFAAVGMVAFQGLLGGMTVIFELPPAISMMHLALSMFFFCFLIYLSFRLWPGQRSAVSAQGQDPIVVPRLWAKIALVAVYIQILLGGLVRHSSSSVVCGDSVPWCQGAAWPGDWQQKIHMLHRYGGVLVAIIVVLATANTIWHAIKNNKSLAFQAAVVAPFLVAVQITLGVLTVTSYIGLVEVVAHLAVGALILANWMIIVLALGPQVDRIAGDPQQVVTQLDSIGSTS